MTFALPQAEPFGARLARHLRALARLAWPVVLSRSGILLMLAVDIAMTGRHSTEDLGAIALAFSVFGPVIVTAIGMTLGVIAAASHAHGAGRPDEAARIWARGMHWGVAIGLVGTAVLLLTGPFLTLTGQTPALAAAGGAAGIALAPGLPAQIVFVVCAFYLEATGRALPALVAMAAANLANVALNWALIPGMGAEGAALGTTLVRFGLAASMIWWVLRTPGLRAALGGEALRPWGPGGWAAGRDMRAIGVSGGIAGFCETAAFASLTFAAGLISAEALGAYSVAHSIEGLVFMLALGMGTAAGVRVGNYHGAGRRDEAEFAGWTGLAATMALVGVVALPMALFPEPVAGVYTTDAEVIARIAPMMTIVAISLVFDGGQAVMGQCCRALGDTWVTAGIFALAFFGVMAPVAWVLAFHTPLAERGLFVGTGIGVATAALLLALRFRALARRRPA